MPTVLLTIAFPDHDTNKNLRRLQSHCRGNSLFHPQHGRGETEYEVEGKTCAISLNDYSLHYPNPSFKKRLRWI